MKGMSLIISSGEIRHFYFQGIKIIMENGIEFSRSKEKTISLPTQE
jgi:hypothetical protein